ncbi:exported hypothetical protein [Candidatus Terasakiella magnetica]|nr:exported hypothetical protein [Candidatus Terasakiella magnetica]
MLRLLGLLLVLGLMAPALADPLPGSYDECLAVGRKPGLSPRGEQALRIRCGDRFIQWSEAMAVERAEDVDFNPFLSWAVDLDGNRGFSFPSDCGVEPPFLRRLTENRADGLRAVVARRQVALAGVELVSSDLAAGNPIRVSVRNGSGIGLTGVVLGLSAHPLDECGKTLSSFDASVYCSFPRGKLAAGSVGEASCRLPHAMVAGSVCIVGFQSSWVAVDDLIRQFAP